MKAGTIQSLLENLCLLVLDATASWTMKCCSSSASCNK